MSATPVTKQIRILDAGSWTVKVEEGQRMVACNPEFFAALLAVAKAMDATSINDDGYTDGLGRVDEAMDALSATHPTWREWQP